MTLVVVIGDIGGEIRVIAIGFDDDTVLVVAMLRGCEPSGAVFFENVALLTQLGDGSLDFTVLVQAVLMEPHVEMYTEILHGFLDFSEHHRDRSLAELFALFGVAFAEGLTISVLAAVDSRQGEDIDAVGFRFVDDTLRDFIDVRALVAVSRGLFAVGCGDQGFGETVDLLAVVIEIVFAHDFGTVGFEHAGHRVADRRPAGAADMDRAGGVGGHEFEVEGLSGQVVVTTELRTLFEYGVHDRRGGRGIKRDIDEAGAGDLDGGDPVGGLQACGEQFRQITRLHAGLLSQLHGSVRRPVAVAAVLGTHDREFFDRRDEILGQGASLAGGDQIMGNTGNQFTERFWIHSSKSSEGIGQVPALSPP